MKILVWNKSWRPKKPMEKTHNFKSNSSSSLVLRAFLSKHSTSLSSPLAWLKRVIHQYAFHRILAIRRSKANLVVNCHIQWIKHKQSLLWIKKLEDYRLLWAKKKWLYLAKVLRPLASRKLAVKAHYLPIILTTLPRRAVRILACNLLQIDNQGPFLLTMSLRKNTEG